MSLIRRTQIESILGAISTNNSTSTPLVSGDTFYGEPEDVSEYKAIGIMVAASHPSAEDGLQVFFSSDGFSYDYVQPFTILSSNAVFYQIPIIARYFRLQYTNGASDLTYLRIQTILHPTATINEKSRIIDDINPQSNVVLNKSVIAGQNVDGDFDTVGVNKEGRLKVSTIDTNEGNEFTMISRETLAPYIVNKSLIIVPSGSIYNVHFNFELTYSDAFYLDFYEDATYINPGFNIDFVVKNRDRNYSDSHVFTTWAYPVMSASGSQLAAFQRDSGGGTVSFSIGNKPGEFILKPGGVYFWKTKNLTANSNIFSGVFDLKQVLI